MMRDLVNRAGDFLVARPAWQLRAAFYVVCGLLVYGFLARNFAQERESGANAVRDSLSASMALRWHTEKQSADSLMQVKGVTLTTILRRTDTLLRQIPETIVTHEDTVRAIEGLPALRLATDSAIKSCSEYQTGFFRYRTACDSLDATRQARIRELEGRLEKASPPPRCRFGGAIGYGIVRVPNGTVYAGPSATAGLTCRIGR